MSISIKVIKEPEDTSEAQDGSRLLATVDICGASHHLTMIRVTKEPLTQQDIDDHLGGHNLDGPFTLGLPIQRPTNPEFDLEYNDVQRLFSGCYATFKVPGFEGDYIAYMHPYDD